MRSCCISDSFRRLSVCLLGFIMFFRHSAQVRIVASAFFLLVSRGGQDVRILTARRVKYFDASALACSYAASTLFDSFESKSDVLSIMAAEGLIVWTVREIGPTLQLVDNASYRILLSYPYIPPDPSSPPRASFPLFQSRSESGDTHSKRTVRLPSVGRL